MFLTKIKKVIPRLDSRFLSTNSRSCSNCYHFSSSTGECTNEDLIFYNPITNKEVYPSAKNARSNTNLCGPSAKNYESNIKNFILTSIGIITVLGCISGSMFFISETTKRYNIYKKLG